MKKELQASILQYAEDHFRDKEADISLFIRKTLKPYPIPTRTVYWVDARKIIHSNGYTHWKLPIPTEWLKTMNEIASERNKNMEIKVVDSDAVHKFMKTQHFTYNPYMALIKLMIVSGRRFCEILGSAFETRNDDAELWYIPKKKASAEWHQIHHLLFDYSPLLFHIELIRLRNAVDCCTHTFRTKAGQFMLTYFGTTHLHLSRSIYVLLLRDKLQIHQNTLPYHVTTWLCHENNSISSYRYLQCEWKHIIHPRTE